MFRSLSQQMAQRSDGRRLADSNRCKIPLAPRIAAGAEQHVEFVTRRPADFVTAEHGSRTPLQDGWLSGLKRPVANRETRLCAGSDGSNPSPSAVRCTTALVIVAGAALYLDQEAILRHLILIAAAFVLLLSSNALAASAGRPQPVLIAKISKQVFGPRWRTAACIAHYESTDGAHLVNGSNLGPWQVNVLAHPWASARRLVSDWWYAARVAFRISKGGRDWSAWSTRGLCGA